MEDNKEVKNFYYVKGNQNNYTINMGEHSSLKLFGDGKEIIDLGKIMDDETVDETLESNEAKEIFSKLRKGGIFDADNMPKGLSLAQRGVLVTLIANRLCIENQWEVFGNYWKMNKETLRRAAYDGYKQTTINKFIGKINTILR